ncbi:MAG: HAMP domain-containing sensor histidine kinase [Polaromonas sp.]|uniref:sensor histidine kinase n=1 Tax=Polaromonas sp. TaxID=1869339 RepID=UPI002734E3CA|nr:HAMP domain-containing sensor histidine kinase [Polaromonas sp.]MDP2820351.1 HAMP domain-containing sensor histidine kinase [Polaromonas sp.]
MIRTRLSITFAALVFLAIAQGLFTLWATRSAAQHAERSVVATSMLNHYLELGANKQRLKVWFAQSALAGDAAEDTKTVLLEKMSRSLGELQKLAPRDAALNRENGGSEYAAIQLLGHNFSVLKASVEAGGFPVGSGDQSNAWKKLISIFDRSDGRDMRSVLEEAVVRQRATSDLAKTKLADALARMRTASLMLAFFSVALGVFAVVYFVKRMHQPFDALVQATTAIAQGNYEYRGREGAADEFGKVARQLNTAAIQLEAARVQSQSVRQGLDDAIAAKTADVTRSHEALLRIDSRRRQFFAEVSHELRTPVTVIRGEAEIALRGAQRDAQDYRASLSRIVDATADLSRRVEDLLHLANSDAEHYPLKLQPTPLSVVIKAALSQTAAVAANRNIAITQVNQVITPEVENVVIHADKDRLQQALTIVLDNAVRYSESPGQVSVGVSVDAAVGTVSIRVTDQGIGLTEGESQGAFERHFRGDRAREMRPDGAGLGLSIAQAIISAHCGEIDLRNNHPAQQGSSVDANNSCGACATLTLPLMQADAASQVAQRDIQAGALA